jgi:hypothetical protein
VTEFFCILYFRFPDSTQNVKNFRYNGTTYTYFFLNTEYINDFILHLQGDIKCDHVRLWMNSQKTSDFKVIVQWIYIKTNILMILFFIWKLKLNSNNWQIQQTTKISYLPFWYQDLHNSPKKTQNNREPRWLNELGSWITLTTHTSLSQLRQVCVILGVLYDFIHNT